MRHGCRWREKLQNHGFRLTVAREIIIETLGNTNEHLSAENIYMTVHPKHPAIGLTTIYRTLEILTQMGIVSKFEFGHGRAKYELSEEYGNKNHHHHLICKKCHKIIDYFEFIQDEIDFIKKTEQGLTQKYKFDIDSHLIRFYGFCPECKKI